MKQQTYPYFLFHDEHGHTIRLAARFVRAGRYCGRDGMEPGVTLTPASEKRLGDDEREAIPYGVNEGYGVERADWYTAGNGWVQYVPAAPNSPALRRAWMAVS